MDIIYNNNRDFITGHFHRQGIKGGAITGRLRHSHKEQGTSKLPKEEQERRELLKLNNRNYKIENNIIQQTTGADAYTFTLKKLAKAKEIKQIGKQANEMSEIITQINIKPTNTTQMLAEQWAQQSLEWFNKQYDGQVISGALHNNEHSIHLHIWVLNQKQHKNKHNQNLAMGWGHKFNTIKKLNDLIKAHKSWTKNWAEKNHINYKDEKTSDMLLHYEKIEDAKRINQLLAKLQKEEEQALLTKNTKLAQQKHQQAGILLSQLVAMNQRANPSKSNEPNRTR